MTPRPRSWSSRKRATVLAAVALAAALGALAVVATSRVAARSPDATTATDGGATPRTGRSAPPAPRPARGQARGVEPAPGSPLELYLHESRYPPTSRPLSREATPDLIDWNARSDEPRDARSAPGTELHFTGDAIRVVGDRPVTTRLRARRAGRPVPVRIARAEVTVEAPLGAPLPPDAARAIPIAFVEQAGEHVATVRPAELTGIDRAVDLVFRVDVDLGAGELERVALAVGYTPEVGTPARFTGTYRDVIEDGSLVIYAGIEVRQAGWYNVDANLWGPGDRPVAWTRFKGELAIGATEVRLAFFGKVLVDAGVAAPWRLGELRGFRYDPEAAPAEQWIDPDVAPFTTRAHALADLSPAEWDAPQRDRAVERLVADEAAGQAPPIPAASFDRDLAR